MFEGAAYVLLCNGVQFSGDMWAFDFPVNVMTTIQYRGMKFGKIKKEISG